MALRTGLGPMGLSGRRYEFQGAPIPPIPPVAAEPNIPPRGGFFSDVLPTTRHIEKITILLEDILFVITREEVIPHRQVEPILVELELPVVYTTERLLLYEPSTKIFEFPYVITSRESQVFYEKVNILLEDAKVFTRENLFEIFKYELESVFSKTTEYQIFRSEACKNFLFGQIKSNTIERIITTDSEIIIPMALEFLGFKGITINSLRKGRSLDGPKKKEDSC